MTRVLALDLALRCTGIAIGDVERGPYFWSTFKTQDWKSKRPLWVESYWHLLTKLYEDHRFTHIAFEDAFVDAKRFAPAGTQGQQYFVALTMLFARLNKLKLMPTMVQTWRSIFIPGFQPVVDPALKEARRRYERRQQNKQAVINECARRGWKVGNQDMADAVGICIWALGKIDPHYAGAHDPIFHEVAA